MILSWGLGVLTNDNVEDEAKRGESWGPRSHDSYSSWLMGIGIKFTAMIIVFKLCSKFVVHPSSEALVLILKWRRRELWIIDRFIFPSSSVLSVLGFGCQLRHSQRSYHSSLHTWFDSWCSKVRMLIASECIVHSILSQLYDDEKKVYDIYTVLESACRLQERLKGESTIRPAAGTYRSESSS